MLCGVVLRTGGIDAYSLNQRTVRIARDIYNRSQGSRTGTLDSASPLSPPVGTVRLSLRYSGRLVHVEDDREPRILSK